MVLWKPRQRLAYNVKPRQTKSSGVILSNIQKYHDVTYSKIIALSTMNLLSNGRQRNLSCSSIFVDAEKKQKINASEITID